MGGVAVGLGSVAKARLSPRNGSRRRERRVRNIGDDSSGKGGGGESLEIDLKAIVGEVDVGGEGGVAFGVESAVSEVGEPGALGFDVLSDFDGLGDGEVGGVRFFAEAIDDEDGDITDKIADGWGDGGAIGEVDGAGAPRAVESESRGGDTAVRDGERNKSGGADGEGSGDGMRFGTDVGGAAVVEIEGVVEGFFESGESIGIGIEGDAVTIFDGVGAEIVEAGDMIGVAVGIEDGIEAGNGGAEGLGSEIGRGIDDDAEVFVFEPDGGAESAVAGVGGGTDAAVAGEHGNALRSSCAEESESHGEEWRWDDFWSSRIYEFRDWVAL